MKQVARKSTAKFAARSHQQNGSVPVQESSAQKLPANLMYDTSLTSTKDASLKIGHSKTSNTNSSDQHKGVHLTNGIHDSCKQVLGNETHNIATAAAVTVRQRIIDHSACTVTSASNLPVSSAVVQQSTLPQSSSNIENSKNLRDVPVKHVNAEPSSHAASENASSYLSNDVIIVKADDSKPHVDSVKRSVSPAVEQKCEVKKARLDGAIDQSVKVDGSVQYSRKVLIICLLPLLLLSVVSVHYLSDYIC